MQTGSAAGMCLLDVSLAAVGDVDRTFETMKAAYLAGDLDRLHAMAEAQTAGADPALMALFEDRLIDARNRRMVERLAPHLARGGTFVAVGALHLSGEAGILNLLAKDGWQVRRVM